jgi:hypothetical protein
MAIQSDPSEKGSETYFDHRKAMMATHNSKLTGSIGDDAKMLISGRNFFDESKIRVRKVNNFKPDIAEMKQLRSMQQTLDETRKPFEAFTKPGSEMQSRRNPGTGSAFYKPASPHKAITKHNVDLLPSQLNHVYV